MKLRHLLLLFISFFFVLPLYAEYFKHIGLSEGLTQPSVMAIYQDRLGRMWFGTKEGISQYDGNRVRIFKGWIKSVGEEPPVWLGNEVSFIVGDSLDNLYFLIDKNLIKSYKQRNSPDSRMKVLSPRLLRPKDKCGI